MIRRYVALLAAIGCAAGILGGAGTLSAAPAALRGGRLHASFQPTDGKVFILVIGNDARSGNPNARGDAIHIVAVNAKTMKGGILNFPRDSWVNVPGHGARKINEALVLGGPELLARTLESMTGIRLDYWVMVGFEGFRKIIGALRGVRIHVPTGVYDPRGSGARLHAGTQTLGPQHALSYVRTRHSFSGGDVTRTTNQGRFLLALLGKLRKEVGQSPAALLRWMAVTQRYARFDMPADEMFRLAVLASQVKPKDVRNVTVPVRIGSVGAASVVFVSSGAHSIFGRFRQNGSL